MCRAPHAILMILLLLNSAALSGVGALTSWHVSLRPNCPNLPWPHVYTIPSPIRTIRRLDFVTEALLLSIAALCLMPHERYLMCRAMLSLIGVSWCTGLIDCFALNFNRGFFVVAGEGIGAGAQPSVGVTFLSQPS